MPKWRFVKYLEFCGPVFHLGLLLSKCHSRSSVHGDLMSLSQMDCGWKLAAYGN